MHRTGRLLAQHEVAVFAYVLSHRGGNSFSQQWPGMAEPWGVCHGDDLYYLFRFVQILSTVTCTILFSPLYHAKHNLTEADLEVRELMLQVLHWLYTLVCSAL